MLKSAFNGLQRRRWQYGSIFIVQELLPDKSGKSREIFRKIQTCSSSRSSKVIDLSADRKHICNFLLFINSSLTLAVISYRFQDIDAFSWKTACFSPPNPCLTPPSWGTPCDINVTYTPLKSTFNGLQFCRWQYGLMAPKSEKSREIPREFQPIAGQGHPRSSILLSIESAYATSY